MTLLSPRIFSNCECELRPGREHGISYLEWHFACARDSKHGLAMITHQERVIALDRGKTDVWKIYEDNRTLAEKQKKYEEQMKNFKPKSVKP